MEQGEGCGRWDGTVLHLDCGSGYTNLPTKKLNVHTHTQALLKLGNVE